MLKSKDFVFNELGVNSFVLYAADGGCILVDPGCNSDRQYLELKNYITENDLKPEGIVLTHGHFDHLAGVAWAKRTFQCPLMMHKDDLFLLENAPRLAAVFGLVVEQPPIPDRFLTETDTITLGGCVIKLLHVPGHSPGSICLFAEKERILVCGDVLFSGSIGRTDLPGGNHKLLIRGIRDKIMTLPPETVVWPGHGPATTIAVEYDTNPFLN